MGQRTVGYLRISLDLLDQGLGVARQREDIGAFIARRPNWQLVEDLFVDNSITASGRKRRPAFEAMLALVEAGEIDVVVGWDWTRLTRTRRDEVRFIEACQAQSVIVSLVRGSDIDMSTPAGRLVADTLAAAARHEIDQKGDRQMRANKQRADRGRPSIGGRRAFGYEIDGMTVREEEAKRVRHMYDALLAGESLNSIARTLNDAGIRTAKDNAFTHGTVRQILTNARNAAIRVYRGVEVGPAAWPALVSETTFRSTVAILADPARTTNYVGGQRRMLLTGVGRCGVCDDGTTVLGGSRGKDQPIYQCKRHGKHLSRLQAPIDHFVEAVVVERLSRPDAAELLIDHDAPDYDALTTDRLDLVARQEQAAIEFADGAITSAMLRVMNERLTARIRDVDQLLANRSRQRVLGDLVRADDVRATWVAMTLERRQAVLNELGTWTILRGKVGGSAGSHYRDDARVRFEPHA